MGVWEKIKGFFDSLKKIFYKLEKRGHEDKRVKKAEKAIDAAKFIIKRIRKDGDNE